MDKQPVPSTAIEQLTAQAGHENKVRTFVGTALMASAIGGMAYGLSGGFEDVHVSQEMPFSAEAQSVVNNIDTVLAVAGAIGIAGCALTVGAVKIGSRRSDYLATIDRWSSQEMTDDGKRTTGFARTALRTVAAGGIPVVAILGSSLGGVMTGIGTEITEGPDRSLEALDAYAPGATYVTQSPYANPMMDQSLSSQYVDRLTATAAAHDISATAVTFNLSNYVTESGEVRSDIVMATAQPEQSIIHFNGDCGEIPVLIDSAADLATGDTIDINNVPARVVGQVEGMSALNRIGIIADKAAVETCIEKGNTASTDFVVLGTEDRQLAEQIAQEAAPGNEAMAVISAEQYRENSREFWQSNVKPITNFIAVVSGGLAMVAVMGSVSERIQRNRREWAAKFAAGVSDNTMRATELLRGAKDGLVAATGGIAASVAVMPVFNVMASGLKAGIGVKEMLVSGAIGTIFPVAGAAIRSLRPRKTINVSENTRV